MFKIDPYSQMDPRWKDYQLGQDPENTIGKFGCLLTCMTMVANGFGHDETPKSLNDRMKSAGGFQGAFIIPAVMPNILPGMRYRKYVKCYDPPAPVAEIDAALASGVPAIVEVDYSPAPGMQNHWVVLYSKEGDDYLIQDPWPYPVESKPVTLTSRYGFAGNPVEIIKAALWFEGAGAPQPRVPRSAPKPVPKDALVVYAAADDLALRQEPFVTDANLIKRMPMHTKLITLEPPVQARAKIGQINQWLDVQEAEGGEQGYVAAWYVSLTKKAVSEVTPQAKPAPTPATGTEQLVVYATGDGLALRKQPVISDANLIKRLPQNAEFVILEPASQAKGKIGVANQWLKVHDVAGDEGFVAAWYVALARQEPALGVMEASRQPPKPSTTPGAPAKLVVRTIEEGLALRKQPVISEATLIKREPLGAELLVLEPVAEAEKKIGVVNKWLNARDIYASEGFVAAWYVVKSPVSTS